MTLLVKSVLGFITSAVIAGTTTSLVRSPKKEPISISKLIWNVRPDRRLLFNGYKGKTDGSSDEWKFVWNKYKNDFSGDGNDPFGISSLTGDNAPVTFMDKCKGLFGEGVLDTESEKYVWVSEYCTRPALVSDWIWGQGYEIVPEAGSEWSSLWKKYNDDGGNPWQITEAANTQPPQQLKTKCTSESNLASGNKDDPSVTKVLAYCSRKRTDAK